MANTGCSAARRQPSERTHGRTPAPHRAPRHGGSLLHPRSRAQAIVEFALILPVLMLLLLVAIDFGRVMFTYIQLNNAAREGVNYAMGQPTDVAGIDQRALQEVDAQGQGGEHAPTITVLCRDSGTKAVVACNAAPPSGLGSQVSVTVTERFTFLTPIIGNILSDFHMSATATAFTLSPAGPTGPMVTPTPGATSTAGPSPTASPSATPTSHPSATPSPSPSPTPSPTATPTPSPTASPKMCHVPNFADGLTKGRDAQGKWTGAGFSASNLTNNVKNNNLVKQQSLGAGTLQPCTTAAITLN